MYLFVIVGAALTLVSLGLLILGGYLLAIRLLPGGGGGGGGRDGGGEEGGRGERGQSTDPLALAVATLLCATAQAVAVALALGASGRLFLLPWALLLQLLLIMALLRWPRRLSSAELRGPLQLLAGRGWARLREHPALAIVALSALVNEALRGLLRPPLSWDGLMVHLLLAASWLQSGHLQPVYGYFPISFLGHGPANGSLWLWWWMAPSHSELYVNFAFLPHCLLLGLAAGGIARQLGARRHWPLASFLVLLTPTVTRYAATQYVDVFFAAALLAACFFGFLWMREPRAWSAALAGAGLGLAAGSKVLGPAYAALLAAALLLLAPGWRGRDGQGEPRGPGGPREPGERRGTGGRRLAQALLALALAAALGGYFYLRNMTLGAGPIAAACAGQGGGPGADWGQQAVDAVLGVIRPQSLELGIGPPALLLLLLFLLMPFALPPARRREGWVAASQVAGELAIWAAVPFAYLQDSFADVRHLIPAIALLFAGGVAIAESHAISAVVVEALALLLAAQGLLQLHAEMSSGVRVAMATIDIALVALALTPALRGFLRRRAAAVMAVVLILLIAGAAPLARFRIADRGRALAGEWTVHATGAEHFAGGWAWLDRHGGEDTVAVAAAPGLFFVYPLMGPFLARRVHVVNVNRADRDSAVAYPACEPRVDPSPEAWVANLRRAEVRWLVLERFPAAPFPIEQRWAEAAPGLFALRYGDRTSLVYEVLTGAPLRARD